MMLLARFDALRTRACRETTPAYAPLGQRATLSFANARARANACTIPLGKKNAQKNARAINTRRAALQPLVH
eukprot:11192002-Lingulodinium_polyedra.AAC.1